MCTENAIQDARHDELGLERKQGGKFGTKLCYIMAFIYILSVASISFSIPLVRAFLNSGSSLLKNATIRDFGGYIKDPNSIALNTTLAELGVVRPTFR
ncbi:hypothetical protein CUMW_253730 [Citrus unshiu]|uniref:Uncharacterized protein n=1 Tax=Citrus unshiu TaxID=55188 RepID=A0A2H5QR31_CITUN|nr:hypothetical protein CUMW_253730 [Citrus unshiu]